MRLLFHKYFILGIVTLILAWALLPVIERPPNHPLASPKSDNCVSVYDIPTDKEAARWGLYRSLIDTKLDGAIYLPSFSGYNECRICMWQANPRPFAGKKNDMFCYDDPFVVPYSPYFKSCDDVAKSDIGFAVRVHYNLTESVNLYGKDAQQFCQAFTILNNQK